jgi:hypothetical protein
MANPATPTSTTLDSRISPSICNSKGLQARGVHQRVMRPFPSEAMRMWPISTRVNKPENDDPSILDEIVLGAEAAE